MALWRGRAAIRATALFIPFQGSILGCFFSDCYAAALSGGGLSAPFALPPRAECVDGCSSVTEATAPLCSA